MPINPVFTRLFSPTIAKKKKKIRNSHSLSHNHSHLLSFLIFFLYYRFVFFLFIFYFFLVAESKMMHTCHSAMNPIQNLFNQIQSNPIQSIRPLIYMGSFPPPPPTLFFCQPQIINYRFKLRTLQTCIHDM